jgi:hypothetical protein
VNILLIIPSIGVEVMKKYFEEEKKNIINLPAGKAGDVPT